MKRYQVVFTKNADTQASAIEDWWIENRPAAPEMFARELDAIVRLLERSPMLGTTYAEAPVPGVRRILIGRSRYHVYREVDVPARIVTITAVWHSGRGSGPQF